MTRQLDRPEKWDLGMHFSRSDAQWLGCKYYRSVSNIYFGGDVVDSRQVHGLAAPWLVVAAGSAIALIPWLARVVRRRRRYRQGQCIHCGYDLRASVERCPECGRPVKRRLKLPAGIATGDALPPAPSRGPGKTAA
jgi:hypothetical protein